MSLKISTFSEGDVIDKKFTCDGANISPTVAWSDAPPGTKSFALIMDDPDAPLGTFVHWVVYNIDASLRALVENQPNTPQTREGITQGEGGLGKVGYRGPCPPGKNPHRYLFHFYATRLEPKIQQGMNKKQLLRQLEGNVIEEITVTLKYGRNRS
jgi:Raf kinase inhibitor-like YbhB/YbcL family protein